jgi:predicted nucleic acid-binding protein
VTYVFDATPLIYLATVDRLDMVAGLDTPCLLPDPVYDEVVTAGRDGGHADARRVERAVEDDWFSVVAPSDTATFRRLQTNDDLSHADSAVLAVADARDGTAVMDERYGRDVAAAEGIVTRGTAYLVLTSLDAGRIDAAEARATVDAMLDAGWYCAPDLYARICTAIDERSSATD